MQKCCTNNFEFRCPRAILFHTEVLYKWFLNYFVWLRITDEGSVPEMCIWSILLIKSDLKWCIDLRRSLFLYSNSVAHIPFCSMQKCCTNDFEFFCPYTILFYVEVLNKWFWLGCPHAILSHAWTLHRFTVSNSGQSIAGKNSCTVNLQIDFLISICVDSVLLMAYINWKKITIPLAFLGFRIAHLPSQPNEYDSYTISI